MRDDRHGRHRRGDGDPRRRPADGYRTRDSRRFRQLVRDAARSLPPDALAAIEGAPLDVRDVPERLPSPIPDLTVLGEVALVSAEAADGRVRRLVVHRRAVELHATDRDDLAELLREALLEAIEEALGGA